jgi:hypothetical protein
MRRFAKVLVPERDRELARDNGGAQPCPILDHFEQVGGSLIGQRLQIEPLPEFVTQPPHISSSAPGGPCAVTW